MDNFSGKVCCCLPVFNNKNTVKEVALACLKYLPDVFVVDDGSTDCDVAALFHGTGIEVVRLEKNRGKGRAIETALKYACERRAAYLITIDADGQHYPSDIAKFLSLLEKKEPTIVVGCRNFSAPNVPKRSKFGRDFSNFWFKVETGYDLSDSQSGFRAYPVQHICRLHLTGFYYDFEAEVLAKAAWAGIRFSEVPIEVWYPPAKERVTSFRPLVDNLRFTLMHMRLIGRRLLPLPHRKVIEPPEEKFNFKEIIRPMELLKKLLKENATPLGLAISGAMGVAVGALPLFSTHSLVIIYIAVRLHLNKIIALFTQNVCMPPVVPILCIELGHYALYKKLLTQFSVQTVLKELPLRAYEWFLGSLVIGPILAVLCGITVYYAAKAMQNKYEKAK